MRNIWLVARYEYLRHVRRRGFLFVAFGMPLLLVAIFGVIALVALAQEDERQLGLVDQTGRFATVDTSDLGLSRPIPMLTFADESSARAALEQGAIDAYFVIPPDYLATGQVRAVAERPLSGRAERQLRTLLRAGLIADLPPAVRDRVSGQDDLVLRTIDSNREIGADNALLFFVPYAFAMLFIFTAFTTSGYLLQALTEEKENRVMELLATSLSPAQMMAGKITGLSAVGLTQMAVWIGLGAVALLVIGPNLAWIGDLRIPWSLLGLSFVYFLLGYLLIAASYALVGAAVTTPQEAQPLVAPISFVAIAPMFLLLAILSEPNGILAVVLSLIPFSAPMTMLMRLPLADVPLWQIVLSLLLLAAAMAGMMWLAARVMRRGMLRYGKRLSLREIVGA